VGVWGVCMGSMCLHGVCVCVCVGGGGVSDQRSSLKDYIHRLLVCDASLSSSPFCLSLPLDPSVAWGTRHNNNPSYLHQHLPRTEVHKALFCLLFMLGCSCPHRWITVPARITFMLGCSCPHRRTIVPARI